MTQLVLVLNLRLSKLNVVEYEENIMLAQTRGSIEWIHILKNMGFIPSE